MQATGTTVVGTSGGAVRSSGPPAAAGLRVKESGGLMGGRRVTCLR